MTSREFIKRNIGNADGKTRSLSSVYKDQNGQIYSYYHHYPLLFEVGGLRFRNTRGYSATTGKHLSWCWDMADVDVELQGCNQYSWRNSENKNCVPNMLYEQASYTHDVATDREILRVIVKDLTVTKDRILAEMQAKKRKDTQIYSGLERDFQMTCGYIARVKAVL